MRQHSTPIKRYAATVPRRMCWRRCKRAPTCTSTSITTHTKRSWTNYLLKERKSEHQFQRRAGGRIQTEEIRGIVRRHGGQHRVVHGGQDRQRFALSRLRYSRYRHAMRVRRNSALAGARETAEQGAARGL